MTDDKGKITGDGVSCSGAGCLLMVLAVALALLLCAQWDAVNVALSRWLTGGP